MLTNAGLGLKHRFRFIDMENRAGNIGFKQWILKH